MRVVAGVLVSCCDGDCDCYDLHGSCCLVFVGCLTSQQHASVSQGRICLTS